MSRPYILAESHWGTVRDTRYDVAILPWGATEAHNFHLPYSTDVIECEVLAAESARLAWERGAKPDTGLQYDFVSAALSHSCFDW